MKKLHRDAKQTIILLSNRCRALFAKLLASCAGVNAGLRDAEGSGALQRAADNVAAPQYFQIKVTYLCILT